MGAPFVVRLAEVAALAGRRRDRTNRPRSPCSHIRTAAAQQVEPPELRAAVSTSESEGGAILAD
jgi:hypothetical protein